MSKGEPQNNSNSTRDPPFLRKLLLPPFLPSLGGSHCGGWWTDCGVGVSGGRVFLHGLSFASTKFGLCVDKLKHLKWGGGRGTV